MARQALDDIAHLWSDDLRLGPTGDLGRSNGVQRSQERVLRRLMTNPGEYVFHPEYGAGLPRKIGENLDLAKIKALIRGQMLLEASVARAPGPVVEVRAISGGVAVRVQYTALPDKQPVSLSFEVQ